MARSTPPGRFKRTPALARHVTDGTSGSADAPADDAVSGGTDGTNTDGSDAGRATRASVRATYERIGDHFAKTREYPWPETEAFLEGADARRGLDLGCGNCRHTELLADVADETVALDASRTLLSVARERLGSTVDGDAAGSDRERRDVGDGDVALVQGDASRLPLASDSVDLAVYVATLHHLPTRATRRASLDELGRVLAPEGRALVSAWSTAHDRFDADADAADGFDATLDWTLPDGTVVDRYYRVYAPAEFERDLAASAPAVARTWLSSGNCYAELRKGNAL